MQKIDFDSESLYMYGTRTCLQARKVFKSVCVCVRGGGQNKYEPYTHAIILCKCKLDFHVLPKYRSELTSIKSFAILNTVGQINMIHR